MWERRNEKKAAYYVWFNFRQMWNSSGRMKFYPRYSWDLLLKSFLNAILRHVWDACGVNLGHGIIIIADTCVGLFWTRHWPKCFAYIHWIQTEGLCVFKKWVPFYRWENWGAKKGHRNISKGKQLASVWAGAWFGLPGLNAFFTTRWHSLIKIKLKK